MTTLFMCQLQSALSSGLGIIYQVAFLLSVILIMSGGLALKGGRSEEAKQAIVGGIRLRRGFGGHGPR